MSRQHSFFREGPDLKINDFSDDSDFPPEETVEIRDTSDTYSIVGESDDSPVPIESSRTIPVVDPGNISKRFFTFERYFLERTRSAWSTAMMSHKYKGFGCTINGAAYQQYASGVVTVPETTMDVLKKMYEAGREGVDLNDVIDIVSPLLRCLRDLKEDRVSHTIIFKLNFGEFSLGEAHAEAFTRIIFDWILGMEFGRQWYEVNYSLGKERYTVGDRSHAIEEDSVLYVYIPETVKPAKIAHQIAIRRTSAM